MGPYPCERLSRQPQALLDNVPAFRPLSFDNPEQPHSIVNAMREHQAMLDAIRDGLINKVRSECPSDPVERANHLKSFAYFADAAVAGCCELPAEALMPPPSTRISNAWPAT